MHDVAMRVAQCIGQLTRDVGDFGDAEGAPRLAVVLHPLPQRLALEPLHRQVVVAADFADVVDAHDVRMRKIARYLGFREEAFLRRGTEGEILTQHLDRDVLVAQAIARRIDVAHAALPEHLADFQTTRQHGAGIHAHLRRMHRRRWRAAVAHHGGAGIVDRHAGEPAGFRDEFVGFDETRQRRLVLHALGVGLGADEPFLDRREPLTVGARHAGRVFIARQAEAGQRCTLVHSGFLILSAKTGR